MKKTAIALGILALLAISWRWSNGIQEDLDPLKVAADTHKLVFENQFVRVLEVRVPPGKTERWHQHGRRVVVYLSDFHTRSTERGGKPQENLRKSGLVRWSEPVIHQVENIGQTEGHVISVDLK
jgi:beta-alanine degradation protein BauB